MRDRLYEKGADIKEVVGKRGKDSAPAHLKKWLSVVRL
jgi:hypothetical protein